MMLAFLIGHIYLGTTGHTPTAHFKAMVTGWDEAH
jgi:thiosulfate reductase cytochrome b subunit